MKAYNNVLITGASAGLGEAMAMRFARMGANLTLNARRLEKLTELKDRLHKVNKKIEIVIAPGDVSHKGAVDEITKQSVNHFGGIDVVIANAGQGMWCRFKDLKDPDQLLELMQLNYMGVVYCLFYGLPHLRKSHGSFVAVSSIQGVIPVAFHTGYVASKYAVNGLIETIRLEEPDVHFLLALPSWISGTELRSHALSGTGTGAVKVKTSHGKHATSSEDCASMIIDALLAKKRDVFVPHQYRFVPILRDMAKNTFDRFVMRKTEGQLKQF
jgi:short-subunit dehydrogenase